MVEKIFQKRNSISTINTFIKAYHLNSHRRRLLVLALSAVQHCGFKKAVQPVIVVVTVSAGEDMLLTAEEIKAGKVGYIKPLMIVVFRNNDRQMALGV